MAAARVAIAAPFRGRSGLRRAGCWLTASRGDPQDSATERKPPMAGPRARTGKGEKVRQERTSGGGDPAGSVNPTRSKAKRGRRAARPVPEKGRSPGRPLRWMATSAFCLTPGQGAEQNPAYRPAHRQPVEPGLRAGSARRLPHPTVPTLRLPPSRSALWSSPTWSPSSRDGSPRGRAPRCSEGLLPRAE